MGNSIEEMRKQALHWGCVVDGGGTGEGGGVSPNMPLMPICITQPCISLSSQAAVQKRRPMLTQCAVKISECIQSIYRCVKVGVCEECLVYILCVRALEFLQCGSVLLLGWAEGQRGQAIFRCVLWRMLGSWQWAGLHRQVNLRGLVHAGM